MTISPSLPCPGCGARNYDPGRFYAVFGLCTYCFEDEDERSAARIRVRTLKPPPERPLSPEPCPHPPGSPVLIEAMAWRLANGFALHHPEDGKVNGCALPPERHNPDPVHPELMMRGVELDRSKERLAYRARPRWRDVRVRLGRFATPEEASRAVKDYFVQRWGRWDESRPWRRRPAALAVVRTKTGWYDLEFPPDVPRKVARRAASRISSTPHPSWWAARAAFRRHLQAELREAA